MIDDFFYFLNLQKTEDLTMKSVSAPHSHFLLSLITAEMSFLLNKFQRFELFLMGCDQMNAGVNIRGNDAGK